IVEEVRDCYAALGIVHSMWKPLPGRFKDYIATPKQNMYQSLHTTVIGPLGEPFEIQIRTEKMHRTAEYGIAAHWRYKEGKTDPEFDKKLAWLREVLEWQRETKDPAEFMEDLKLDIFSDEVFVFTPKGDVIGLPASAIPLDFAYRIHTEVGHSYAGARVNGRMVPSDYTLQNGDIVEILTRPEAQPSLDWLSLVRTSAAKNRIRQWFKKANRAENLDRGKELLVKELRHLGLSPQEVMTEARMEELRKKVGTPGVEELLVSIGYGGLSASQVAHRLRDLYRQEKAQKDPLEEVAKPKGKEWGAPSGGVSVKGVDHVLVRFPNCCHPVPGDKIVGYITRGRGVTIHRADCRNVNENLRDPERLIEVRWHEVNVGFYPVELEVIGSDRPGLLSDVARQISESRVNIVEASARSRGGGSASIHLVLQIRDTEQLEYIKQKLLRIPNVHAVERPMQRAAR
ncbi:MAG: TGS domain-containing protein, partial [Bacillota bacterium]|nr:TGS domain-containing protein [Bacillota bacterium]